MRFIPRSHVRGDLGMDCSQSPWGGDARCGLDAVGLSTSDAVDLILEPGDLALWSPPGARSGTKPSATSADSTSTARRAPDCDRGEWGSRGRPVPFAAGPSSSITRNYERPGRTTSKRQLMSAMGGKRTLVDAVGKSMDKLECYGLSRKSPPYQPVRQSAREELPDECSNPCTMRLESEMSGVEHVDLRVGIVAKVSLAAGSDEDLTSRAPHHERRRPAAEIVLPLGIEGKVGSVIVEQVELDVGVARSVHQRLVMRPGVWASIVGSSTPFWYCQRWP